MDVVFTDSGITGDFEGGSGGLTTVSWLTTLNNTSLISFPQKASRLKYPSDHKQRLQRHLNEVGCLSYFLFLDCINFISRQSSLLRSFIHHCYFSAFKRVSWSELSASVGREAVFLPKINRQQLLDNYVVAVPAKPVVKQSHEMWKHLKAMTLDTALITLDIHGKCTSVDKQPHRMLAKWIPFICHSPFSLSEHGTNLPHISLIADG